MRSRRQVLHGLNVAHRMIRFRTQWIDVHVFKHFEENPIFQTRHDDPTCIMNDARDADGVLLIEQQLNGQLHRNLSRTGGKHDARFAARVIGVAHEQELIIVVVERKEEHQISLIPAHVDVDDHPVFLAVQQFALRNLEMFVDDSISLNFGHVRVR